MCSCCSCSECNDIIDCHTTPPHRDECRALQITSATTDLTTRFTCNHWRSKTIEVDVEQLQSWNARDILMSIPNLNLTARCQSHQTLVLVFQLTVFQVLAFLLENPEKTWAILSQVTQLIQAKNHLHEMTPVREVLTADDQTRWNERSTHLN